MEAEHVACKDEFQYRDVTWNRYTNKELIQRSEKFQFRKDDIVVATFPRSGTTLTQEIVWQIVHHSEVEKDAKYPDIDERFPFLEFDPSFYGEGLTNPIDILEQQSGGRLIKTHLPYFLLREQLEKVNPKIVIVMRNPKDNICSMFHFYRHVHNFDWRGTWPQFLRLYMQGRTFSGDFFANNLEWWSLRERPNVKILRYEDILHQPFQEIRDLANFLGVCLTPEKIATIVHNTSFKVMSKNELVNIDIGNGASFLRKGVCGDWKNTFTVAEHEAIDRHCTEKLRGTGLSFYYE